MEVTVTSRTATSTWSIPKALLSRYSKFFHVACNGPFKEGQKNKIVLPECNPKLFQLFVQWIYFNTISDNIDSEEDVWNAFRAWALGDRLMASEFKNCIMKLLHETHAMDDPKHAEFADKEMVWCANNTMRGSRLQTWFIDTLAQHWVYEDYIKDDEEVWVLALDACPDLRTELLYKMVGMCKGEAEVKPLATYLEE